MFSYDDSDNFGWIRCHDDGRRKKGAFGDGREDERPTHDLKTKLVLYSRVYMVKERTLTKEGIELWNDLVSNAFCYQQRPSIR